jgi:predicted GTPase
MVRKVELKDWYASSNPGDTARMVSHYSRRVTTFVRQDDGIVAVAWDGRRFVYSIDKILNSLIEVFPDAKF